MKSGWGSLVASGGCIHRKGIATKIQVRFSAVVGAVCGGAPVHYPLFGGLVLCERQLKAQVGQEVGWFLPLCSAKRQPP